MSETIHADFVSSILLCLSFSRRFIINVLTFTYNLLPTSNKVDVN